MVACLEETLGSLGSYITLSHRWNHYTEVSKTTQENCEERKLGRLLLPELLKDALYLAFICGIKYVWIDSVCIIQEGEDFERESVKMVSCYQKLLFRIATTINSSEGGLELGKTPTSLLPRLARLPYRDKPGQ
jgi:hypothetical protein